MAIGYRFWLARSCLAASRRAVRPRARALHLGVCRDQLDLAALEAETLADFDERDELLEDLGHAEIELRLDGGLFGG